MCELTVLHLLFLELHLLFLELDKTFLPCFLLEDVNSTSILFCKTVPGYNQNELEHLENVQRHDN